MKAVEAAGWRHILSYRRIRPSAPITSMCWNCASRSQLSTSSRRRAVPSISSTSIASKSIAPEQLPSPRTQAALRSAKLAALHARLSLPSRLPVQTLARCLVDHTADPDTRFNNTSLAVLGGDLLAYYTSEHLICHYPRLPMDVLMAAVSAYVGPKALTTVAKEWGVDSAEHPGGEVDPGLLQFARPAPGTQPPAIKPEEQRYWQGRGLSSGVVYDDEFGQTRPSLRLEDLPETTTLETASAQFVRAVVGSICLHAGQYAAKRFHKNYFQARALNISSIFDFKFPTRDLSRLCLREGFESPVARLESETGRLSRHPVFVVGVYSGRDKLGEGAGASLDEARIRAAAAALKGWYLYSPMDVVTPSEVEGGDTEKRWKPNMVDMGEIIT